MNDKKRENWIDFVKLIAMLIVVMNHASCTVPLISFWGGMFFVPVFFVLSGFTYVYRDEKFPVVMRKKARRLLVPYFTANFILLVFFLLKDVVFTHTKSVSQMMQSIFGIFYARNQIFSFDHQTLFVPVNRTNYYLLTNQNFRKRIKEIMVYCSLQSFARRDLSLCISGTFDVESGCSTFFLSAVFDWIYHAGV